ncbi:MAG: VCBS repeat-containing protein [Kiritimatiellae bacterium]|nr:VCBS repeat-containing protein [Kiritimatiellia bacterium]
MRFQSCCYSLVGLLLLSGFCGAANEKLGLFDHKEGASLLRPPTEPGSFIGGTKIADFNGDGAPDLAAWVGGPKGAVYIYLNKNGRWADPQDGMIVFPKCGGCETGDIDNDGKTDLVMFERGKDLKIFLNKGGSFANTPDRQIAIVGGASYCLVGDFDTDGKTDLAVSAGDTKVAFQIFLGKHGLDPARKLVKAEGHDSGVYGPLTWRGKLGEDSASDFLAGPRWVALLPNDTLRKGYFGDIYTDHWAITADLDGDGTTDVLTTQRPGPGKTIFLRLFYGPFAIGEESPAWQYGFNIGPMQTTRFTEIPVGPAEAWRLPIATDINGDRRTDILMQVAQAQNGKPKWRTLVYTQNRPMGFEPEDPPGITLDGSGDTLYVADLNRDGLADLILCGHEPGTLRLFINRNGQLPADASRPDQVLAVGNKALSAIPADLNGDGWPDLIVQCQGQVAIYLNQGGAPFPAGKKGQP